MLRNEDGTTSSWLDKSTVAAGGCYEDKIPGATNWRETGLGEYYWETEINAEAFTDIHVKGAFAFSYNTKSRQTVEVSLDGQKWDEITAMCKEAVKTMLGFSLAHVGLNCENEAEAGQSAKTLCALFGFEYKPGNSSIFAGSAVECMKSPYLGKNGHIAIATNSLDRAVYHLGRQGVEFDESTRKPKAIYLKQEVGGFAIHLVQR